MRRGTRALIALIGLIVISTAGWMLPAHAVDVGYIGPSHTGTTAPTGQKPQSKLWVAHGSWWGSLFDSVSRDFHIFRYDWAANRWVDTGVLIDDRPNSFIDVLWDGRKLYIVGAGATATNAAHSPRVTRFSYNTATKRWVKDLGFPVTVAGGGVEAAVIAKDSRGLLWVTFTQSSKVWLNHSRAGNDLSWVGKYKLPTPGLQSDVVPDDMSAIVAYSGNRIGVLWSNQRSMIMYWASHLDGTQDRLWSVQVAYARPEGADDHINLKSLVGDPSGRVFAVTKTSMNAGSDPLFNLLVLSPGGQWTSRVVWTQVDDTTRAIVQLDVQRREVYVFAAAPCCTGGTIYYKKSSLDAPRFGPGLGTAFISSGANPEINNPTSTKQNLSSATGLLVLASSDQTRRYLYNRMSLGGAASALFADDFSTGGFSSGGWTAQAAAPGTASVVAGAVQAGNPGVRLTSTTAVGSAASIRKVLAPQSSLAASFDARVVSAGSAGTSFALAKLYDSSGVRQLSVLRDAGTGALRIQLRASTVPTTAAGKLANGQVARITIRVAQGASGDTLVVSVNGTPVYSSTTVDLGALLFSSLRLGDDSLRRALDYRVDQIQVAQ